MKWEAAQNVEIQEFSRYDVDNGRYHGKSAVGKGCRNPRKFKISTTQKMQIRRISRGDTLIEGELAQVAGIQEF